MHLVNMINSKYSLSDTETLYTDIMQEICNPHNKTFNWDVKKKQMGRKQREAGEILIGKIQAYLYMWSQVVPNN